MLVVYFGRLDGLAEELLQVPLADIAGELADVALRRPVPKEASVDLARDYDPDLHYLQLAPEAAAGVQEPERLVGCLGPAVEVVGPRVVFGANAVLQPCVVRPLVPFGGLIGAGGDHPPHTLLQREPVDALHHVHVAPLALVLRDQVLAFRFDVPAVDYDVHAGEQGLQRGVVRGEQVDHLDPFDPVAGGVRRSNVDEPEIVVALPEGPEELAGDVA